MLIKLRKIIKLNINLNIDIFIFFFKINEIAKLIEIIF